jgi:hypothetical protein
MHMKYGKLRRFAASAENGSWVARSNAVQREYRIPIR